MDKVNKTISKEELISYLDNDLILSDYHMYSRGLKDIEYSSIHEYFFLVDDVLNKISYNRNNIEDKNIPDIIYFESTK